MCRGDSVEENYLSGKRHSLYREVCVQSSSSFNVVSSRSATVIVESREWKVKSAVEASLELVLLPYILFVKRGGSGRIKLEDDRPAVLVNVNIPISFSP